MQLKYRQKDNKLFLLSRNDIEEISCLLLSEYSPKNISEPIPLNTKGFTEDYLGLTVKYRYIGSDKKTSALGLIVMDNLVEIPSYDDMFRPIIIEESYGTVLITPQLLGEKNMPRRRYTQMHEAAHYILHREYFNYLSCQSSKQDTDELYIACRKVELCNPKPKTELEWMEWQADALAASILMPKDAFSDFADSVLRKNGISRGYALIEQYDDKRNLYEIVAEIAQKFNVSHKAAQIRMLHLGLIKSRRLNSV